jgi:hypothetical protein
VKEKEEVNKNMSDIGINGETARKIFESAIRTTPDLLSGRGSGNKPIDHVVYECYVYALVLQVLHELNYNPRAVYLQSQTFAWRPRRGKVYHNPKKYSHVEFTANGKDFVLLNDIEVHCKSPGVELEVDVLILSKQHFDDCLNSKPPLSPSYSELRLLLEAKHYSSDIDISVSKAFVGMCDRLRDGKCFAILVSKSGFTFGGRTLLDGVVPSLNRQGLVFGTLTKPHVTCLMMELKTSFLMKL